MKKNITGNLRLIFHDNSKKKKNKSKCTVLHDQIFIHKFFLEINIELAEIEVNKERKKVLRAKQIKKIEKLID